MSNPNKPNDPEEPTSKKPSPRDGTKLLGSDEIQRALAHGEGGPPASEVPAGRQREIDPRDGTTKLDRNAVETMVRLDAQQRREALRTGEEQREAVSDLLPVPKNAGTVPVGPMPAEPFDQSQAKTSLDRLQAAVNNRNNTVYLYFRDESGVPLVGVVHPTHGEMKVLCFTGEGKGDVGGIAALVKKPDPAKVYGMTVVENPSVAIGQVEALLGRPRMVGAGNRVSFEHRDGTRGIMHLNWRGQLMVEYDDTSPHPHQKLSGEAKQAFLEGLVRAEAERK